MVGTYHVRRVVRPNEASLGPEVQTQISSLTASLGQADVYLGFLRRRRSALRTSSLERVFGSCKGVATHQ
jgi:hypothetical protein